MGTKGDSERARRVAYALNRLLGVPQERIAEQVGVAFSTVSRWINGRTAPQQRSLPVLERMLAAATAPPAAEPVRAIVARLHVEYGSPHLNNKSDPLDELFFILLSLKTSHLTYEATYERFRERFQPWDRLLAASAEEVESYIRSGGLGSIKARAFIDIARRLQADFGAVTLAPLEDMDDGAVERYLCSLPGVGVKTARCVAMYSLGRNALPVDTHTYRVGVRLGIVPTSKSPGAVHGNFDRAVPAELSYPLHTNFVAHGRAVCTDPTPKCGQCVVRDLCATGSANLEAAREPAATARRVARRRDHGRGDQLVAADIYAGCGGLSAGMEDAGIHVAYALDWDEYAAATHRENFPQAQTECRDVREVSGQHILRTVGRPVDLLAGGPNCQGVSQLGLRSPDDPRNFMLQEFMRLVSEIRPRAFLFENVPGLAHRHNYPLLKQIFSAFAELGYRCAADVLLAADYGVPQLRYRFFMVGALDDTPLSFPAPTHASKPEPGLFLRPYVTVGEAIGDLPLEAPRGRDAPVALPPHERQSEFLAYVREGAAAVYNHFCADTAELNLRRISYIPEGGNWKDIPADLLPRRLFHCRMTDHSTTYARLRRDHPSFTITGLFSNVTSGAFTHPVANRALSVREGARLQSFRDRFRIHGPRSAQYSQVGNAVPPLLSRAVAGHLKALLLGTRVAGVPPRITPELVHDPRGWDAFPILTPRFMPLFGTGTRWPKGWGPEPERYADALEGYYLKDTHLPAESEEAVDPANAA